jgi:L-2-hydroxyglutarate oxidase LhgO
MDYDVLILGGGIVGCAAAYELSKYSLNIALIEKDYDIAEDVAIINTAIIYDGTECEDTLMSKLEFMGSSLMPEITSKFNIPYKRCGYMMIAEDSASNEKLKQIYNNAVSRGVNNLRILNSEEVNKMEPDLNLKVESALYSKNTAIICPYDLAIAYGEVAFDNGVNFKLEEEVLDIKKINKGFKVITNKNKFTCHIVIDTTPKEDYSIDVTEKLHKDRSNMEYFLLEKNIPAKISNIITTMNENNEKIYILPVIQGGTAVALKSEENLDYKNGLSKVSKIIGDISEEDITTYMKTDFYNDSIIIDDSLIHQGYIKVVGKHYGQVTMTPAIAKIVCETITNNTHCVLKKNFTDKRRDFYRFRDLDNEERKKIIEMNSYYGKIICSCNCVSEGEIIDSIRRPLGARTIEGIARRTGAMRGNCLGAQCMTSIARILARETDKKMSDIVKDSRNSKIVVCRIKEFDKM